MAMRINLEPDMEVFAEASNSTEALEETVYAERVLRADAQGYVMKQEPGKVLANAICEVLKGNLYLSRQIQAGLLTRLAT
ncbi:hypothetical protein [Nitrosospira sp. Nsp2]|uniref:hypothetical protein n=1 Tax=Nitrosospira sp. Nsp2 TaxID=136548 RepID=UPI002159361B|nr:hypothetical protein [Nitrosospira sp. Nsp2]